MSKELTVPIPARLKNVAKNGHVAGVEDIYDDELQKTQKEINAERENDITNLDNEVSALQKQDIEVVADHTAVTNPDPKKIYREQGTESYTDYMYQNNTWKDLATYAFPGIDEEPTAESKNLVESGGVAAALEDIKPAQINGKSQSFNDYYDLNFTDGEYKKVSSTTISTNSMLSMTTIEFEVEEGDTVFLKLSSEISSSLYTAYFIFAIDATTASIDSHDINDYIELVDENKHLWKLTVPPQTTKIFSATEIVNKESVFAYKISEKKELKWLSVFEDNLSQPIKDKINNVTPDRIYGDAYTFNTEQYIVQSYTEEGFILSPFDAGGIIEITTNTTVHSAIIPVQAGDVLIVKNGQNIAPIDGLARRYYGFGSVGAPMTACVSVSDYPNLITSINETQYKVNIPQGCGYFYLTMLDINRADDNVLFAIDKKNLKWLKVNEENFAAGIINNIINQSVSKAVPESVSEMSTKLTEESAKYHIWDSIKKPIVFNGKTLSAFGDSITRGVASPGLIDAGDDKYISQFCQITGAILSNYGSSGSCITDNSTYDSQNATFKTIKVLDHSDTDIIWIAGGTNDWNTGKPIGTYNSTDVATLYGALRNMCEWLTENRPNAVVIFVTPIPYTKPESAYPSHIAPLDAYRSAIYDIATEYGYSVVDGKSLGMPREQGDWNDFMCADGLHPTINGHKLMARSLCGKLL